MKKLTMLLLLVSGCAFDTSAVDRSPVLEDDAFGTIDTGSSERPHLPSLVPADQVAGALRPAGRFELEDQVFGEILDLEDGRCAPHAFVGCTSDEDAVYCGEDGRSLTVENCDAGCNVAGCIPNGPALPAP